MISRAIVYYGHIWPKRLVYNQQCVRIWFHLQASQSLFDQGLAMISPSFCDITALLLMRNLSSQVAPDIVVMITYSAANDDKISIVTTLPFIQITVHTPDPTIRGFLIGVGMLISLKTNRTLGYIQTHLLSSFKYFHSGQYLGTFIICIRNEKAIRPPR